MMHGQPTATTARGATGSSLWRRLCALQPTLRPDSGDTSLPPSSSFPALSTAAMSYSFVVVPPPVPAATPSFESHLRTLLTHVPHPTFVTCTSYSPYFTSAAAAAARGTAASACVEEERKEIKEVEESATQRALTFLNTTLPAGTGLVLTLTATRATTAAAAATADATTLTGATEDGTRAVLCDFAHRVQPPGTNEATGRARRPAGFMVLRGDDGGYTRRQMAGAQDPSTHGTSSPNPYSTFADGPALLRFVSHELQHPPQPQHSDSNTTTAATSSSSSSGGSCRDEVTDVCLLTGGYGQGHVLDRVWGEGAAGTPDDPTAAPATQRRISLSFLDRLDHVYADTEARLRHAQGSHQRPRTATVESCQETADALLARLHAVRLLWLTPSHYSAEARTAAVRQLVEDKVLLLPKKGEEEAVSTAEGARVVVTQMLTSAQEFTQFHTDVQRALKVAAAAATIDGTSLVLVPGLMSPLRAEHFLRSTLQLKVIPSVPLQSALETYAEGLTEARSHLLTRAAAAGAEEDDAVAAFEQARESAEVAFQTAMEDFTVAVAGELRDSGFTHVNFSAFQYGCGEAVGRVAARLSRAA